MTETVLCSRYGDRLPALENPPMPGALGKRIKEAVSARAWAEWTEEEVLVINHYALSLVDPEHQRFLMERMNAWLFEQAPGVDTSKPPVDGPPRS